MTKNPIISVILPVYNAEKFVYQAIDSILKQSFTNFELIIINDGSSDRSNEIINGFTDERIKLIQNKKNLGLIGTLNKGFSLAEGDYIARMDADDISMPNRFEKQLNYLLSNPDIDIIGSNYCTFGFENNTVSTPSSHEQIKVEILFNNCICHPSVIFRAEALQENNITYNSEFLHTEDWNMWFEAIRNNLIIKNIDEVLLNYRLEGQNITARNRDTIKERYFKMYTLMLSPLFPDLNNNILELHWSLSQSEINNFTAKDINRYCKLLTNRMVASRYSKKETTRHITLKKNKLFFKHADYSFFKGLIFIIVNRQYKIINIKYLLSKL